MWVESDDAMHIDAIQDDEGYFFIPTVACINLFKIFKLRSINFT